MTTKASLIDLNGNEMILDADGDTTITADTDDQIDIKVGGSDTVHMGLTTYNASDRIVLTNTGGNASATIVAGTSGESSIFMADGTSGDASYRGYLQYQHANDNWNFGTAATLAMKIDSAGHVTKPLQSYFLAYRSGNQAGFNSAGDFGAVVQYNAELADINGDFNTSTGLFTAPVDGTYWFIASAYGSSFQQAWLAINTGSGAARATYTDFNVGGYSGDVFTAVFYVNLDANDTVGYHPYTSTSTSVTIIANAYHTWFKGGLLY